MRRGQGSQGCLHGACFCGFVNDWPHSSWGSHFQQLSVGNASPVDFITGFQKLVPWLSPPFTFCLYSGCFGAPVPFPPAKACLPAQSPHVSESGTHLYSLSNSREYRPRSPRALSWRTHSFLHIQQRTASRGTLSGQSLPSRWCSTLATSSSPPRLQAVDEEGCCQEDPAAHTGEWGFEHSLAQLEDPRLCWDMKSPSWQMARQTKCPGRQCPLGHH